MVVDVQFLPPLSVIFGRERLSLTLPEGANTGVLREELRRQPPAIKVKNSFMASLDLLIKAGDKFCQDSDPLQDGETVYVIAPMLGG